MGCKIKVSKKDRRATKFECDVRLEPRTAKVDGKPLVRLVMDAQVQAAVERAGDAAEQVRVMRRLLTHAFYTLRGNIFQARAMTEKCALDGHGRFTYEGGSVSNDLHVRVELGS